MLCIRVFGRGVSGERDDAYVVEYGTKSRTFECDFRESLVRRNSSNVQAGRVVHGGVLWMLRSRDYIKES